MAGTSDRAASAAEGRLLALGSVVPGIVHELNNALLGLLGMLELAQADAPPAVAERLAIAQRAGDEIRELARVLGALAREPLDHTATLELRDVATEAADATRALNLVRGLDLTEIYAPESAAVTLSPAQVRHALLLLLSSAFTGSGREGGLVLEVKPVGEQAHVHVRFSGAGTTGELDPTLDYLADWAAGAGGQLVRERTSLTLILPRVM